METIQNSGKILNKEEQKKIAGGDTGNQYCFTMQGSFGTCKTDAMCDLDLPLCEPV